MGKLVISKMFQLIQSYLLSYLPNERKLSVNTIRSYRRTLSALLEFAKSELDVPLYQLSFEDISKSLVMKYLLSIENDGCSARTRNQRLYAIQSFFKFSAREDMDAVYYWDQIRKIQPAKVDEHSIGYLSEEALQLVFDQPDLSTEKGARDAFIMVLLYKTGCRVQELTNIRLLDIHICNHSYITLHGKGSKDRNVPLRESTTDFLKKYLSIFHRDRASKDDFLIFSVRDGSRRKMTEDNIRKIIKKYGEKANAISSDVPSRLHPHMFRHSFAMHAYQHGVPLEILKDWLGHSDFSATRVYAKADTEMKRKAIEKAFPKDSPLYEFMDSSSYTINDEELLKQLCGLT